MGKGWKNSEEWDFKSLHCFEKKVGGNMYIKGDSGESSEKSEEHIKLLS